MDSATKIIHIGFPKTATTFLQKNVFPFLENVDYVSYKECESLFLPIIYLDDLDLDLQSVTNDVQEYFGSSTSVFSLEALTGAPFIYKGQGRSNIADRLKKIGFDKVIVTVRDQVDLIDSMYRQYVIQGGVVRFKDFLNLDDKIGLYRRSFNLEYLNYYKLIMHYAEIFGRENVLVLSHHMLRNDKVTYLKRIESFCGANLISNESSIVKRENTSLTNLSINLLRFVNHFILTSQRPNHLIWNKIETKYVSKAFKAILDPYLLRFFSSKKSYLSKKDAEILVERYLEENQKLIEEFDLGSKI